MVAEGVRVQPQNARTPLCAMVGGCSSHHAQPDHDDIISAHLLNPPKRHPPNGQGYQQAPLKREEQCRIVIIQE